MLESLTQEKTDHNYEVVIEAIEKVQSEVHVTHKQLRKLFLDCLCADNVKQNFQECVRGMIDDYWCLFKLNSKGKHFARFKQAWLTRIHDYFMPDQQVCSSWSNIVAKCDCATTIEEQRLVISSLMYAIYDIITRKVKDFKERIIPHYYSAESTCNNDEEHKGTVGKNFLESNISLYWYIGFALHSLLQKYKGTENRSPKTEEVCLLEKLVVKNDQMNSVPDGIKYLNKDGLTLMNPCMLHYTKALIKEVSSHVNKECCYELGKDIIAAALTEIENDEGIAQIFKQCIMNTEIDSSSPLIFPKIYHELCKKMFHALVNKFMTAAEELELEKKGKAVKVDQCLHDQLKTYSSNMHR